MIARVTTTGVVVTHEGFPLITRRMPAEARSRVAMKANAILRHSVVTGDSIAAWVMRRRMAADALNRAVDEVAKMLDVSV